MSRSPSYKRATLEDRYDAIVVGSGIGGLGVAAMLAKLAKRRVLVLERHYVAGGFTHAFTRPGFEWDVGVHYVGGVVDPESPLLKWWDFLTEGRLEWASVGDVYDEFLIGQERYEFPRGRERWRESMQRRFPSEARAIDEYLAATWSSNRWSALYFAEKLLPPLLRATVGPLMRAPFLRRGGRTTLDVLRGFTLDEELIGVLTGQWGDYGAPPSLSSFGAHATMAEHYFDGAGFPVGGAGRIAESILPVIEREGGAVVVSADVQEVLVADGRARGVRMADGRELLADTVISDAGAVTTYEQLVGDESATKVVRDGIAQLPPSPGHVCLYVGLDESSAEAGLPKANLWVHPTRDHDANWKRLVDDPEAPLPLYFSFSSAKDPSFEERHPGHATVDVLAFVPFDWFSRWEATRWGERGADYDAFKARLTERLTEALYRHVPGARGHVVHAELSTPLSTRHFTNHAHGEVYGLGHTPERYRYAPLGPRTPIRKLYLTGNDVGVFGVTGALSGAALCASAILRKNVYGELAEAS
ncbi:MAG: NAD(P)/FAD-dependent oxidoreductase [Planctomycetes bacterium]|nr:NAD(P)/FAD-dependent oxidoreductase [Planctomycetota bacterium]MCB9903508.1 NAD(P)/FAD-dependent oxidoreductase [Planctomycetota bacterium]